MNILNKRESLTGFLVLAFVVIIFLMAVQVRYGHGQALPLDRSWLLKDSQGQVVGHITPAGDFYLHSGLRKSVDPLELNNANVNWSVKSGDEIVATASIRQKSDNALLGDMKIKGTLTQNQAIPDATEPNFYAFKQRNRNGELIAAIDKDGNLYLTGSLIEYSRAVEFQVASNWTVEQSETRNIVVELSSSTTATVTVDFRLGVGTATLNEDFSVTTGTLTFAAQNTQESISLDMLPDFDSEGTEYHDIGTVQSPLTPILDSKPSTH